MHPDVLCVGHAAYDLIFCVKNHPGPDEKSSASRLTACGGGPAANAAIAAARLGAYTAFAGYLGTDPFGQLHLVELKKENIDTSLVIQGHAPTPLCALLVKPDGKRTVVNYRGETRPLDHRAIDFSKIFPKVILFDGHEPNISQTLMSLAADKKAITVLDAGSLNPGTNSLAGRVDYLIASEKFGRDFTGEKKGHAMSAALTQYAAHVIVTLGERGLVWAHGESSGTLAAYPVNVLDTTGAGDAFHGAFAAGLAMGIEWQDLLQFSSAAAALNCRGFGGRLSAPTKKEVDSLVRMHPLPK